MPLIDNYLLSNRGIDGPSGVKYASGIVIAQTRLMDFYVYDSSGSNSITAYPIEVSGLPFRPNRIIIRSGLDIYNIYHFDTRGAIPSDSSGAIGGPYNYCNYLITPPSNGRQIVVFEKLELNDTINAYVKNTGFRLPAPSSGGTYGWEAFGV